MKKLNLKLLVITLLFTTSVYAQQIDLGHRYSVSICNGNLYVSGQSFWQGALGLGALAANTTDFTLNPFNFGSSVDKVFSNDYTTFVSLTNGEVWGFGNNWLSALGIGGQTDQPTPIQIPGAGGQGFLTDVVEIQSADWGANTIALTTSGQVLTWGGNNGASALPSIVPMPANFTGNVVQVCGAEHSSYILDNQGHVWSLYGHGLNAGPTYAPLGLGNGVNYVPTPTQIPTLNNITNISSSGTHCLAVDNNGSVWSWGENGAGQLGIGNNVIQSVPVQVLNATGTAPFTGALRVFAALDRSFILATNGTLWSFGLNASGSLGIGTNTSPQLPVQVLGLPPVQDVVLSQSTTLAITGQCAAFGFGNFSFDNLGPNLPNNSTAPFLIDQSNTPCCGGFGTGGGNNEYEVVFEASDSTICENDCIDFRVLDGALLPNISPFLPITSGPGIQWSFPGSSNTNGYVQGVGVFKNVLQVCYGTAGTYPVLAKVDGVVTNTGISITVINKKKCNYEPIPQYKKEKKQVDSKKQLKIYPNPTRTGLFTISVNAELIGNSFNIVSTDGRIVKKGILKLQEQQIDLSKSSRGIYYLSFEGSVEVIPLAID